MTTSRESRQSATSGEATTPASHGEHVVANLVLCVLYCQVVIALSGDRQGRLVFGGGGVGVLLILVSPGLLWALIAWIAARRPRLSALTLLISTLLMVLSLLGHYADRKLFQGSVPGQEGQLWAGFLGMVLQWFVGAVLLWVVVVVRLISRMEMSDARRP